MTLLQGQLPQQLGVLGHLEVEHADIEEIRPSLDCVPEPGLRCHPAGGQNLVRYPGESYLGHHRPGLLRGRDRPDERDPSHRRREQSVDLAVEGAGQSARSRVRGPPGVGDRRLTGRLPQRRTARRPGVRADDGGGEESEDE